MASRYQGQTPIDGGNMETEIDKSNWERQWESLEWPPPWSEELLMLGKFEGLTCMELEAEVLLMISSELDVQNLRGGR